MCSVSRLYLDATGQVAPIFSLRMWSSNKEIRLKVRYLGSLLYTRPSLLWNKVRSTQVYILMPNTSVLLSLTSCCQPRSLTCSGLPDVRLSHYRYFLIVSTRYFVMSSGCEMYGKWFPGRVLMGIPALVAVTTLLKNCQVGVPAPTVQSMGLLCRSSSLMGAD